MFDTHAHGRFFSRPCHTHPLVGVRTFYPEFPVAPLDVFSESVWLNYVDGRIQ